MSGKHSYNVDLTNRIIAVIRRCVKRWTTIEES